VLAVAYFAALLARSADRWQARDADLDEIEDVAGLVEFMREIPDEDGEEDEPDTAVLLLEQEEVWFAVVRLDAEEDPRLFVSDAAAVSRSAHADLLLSTGLVPCGPDGSPAGEPALVGAAVEAVEAGGALEAERPDLADLADLADGAPAERRPVHPGPAGDAALLEDFGVRAARLVGLCRDGLLPADALADLAEALGAADELEEVR
jgi:putative tRNA adenosine deaminase-associated protein